MPNQWRPISEAPKDGNGVLALAPVLGRQEYCLLRWIGDAWKDADGYSYDPTHFMFLPDPPDIEG